ncbi:hypothetical protein ABZS66_27040 [Dactylosporangium sp. NPDC005572]|uniref:hypothetical protein n=1 Tax=Dactylosporangium sp. NPDC005572 TaxID=3156889 RepID=UPI0033B9805D
MFITGRRKVELDDAVRVIGQSATAVPGDITNPNDLDRSPKIVAARGQGQDVLFANAATASFTTIKTQDDQRQRQERHLSRSQGTSGAERGHLGNHQCLHRRRPSHCGFGACAASEAAVRAWANELKGRIGTSGVTELVGEGELAQFKANEGAQIAIARIGRPNEVAATAAFLASTDSSFMVDRLPQGVVVESLTKSSTKPVRF